MSYALRMINKNRWYRDAKSYPGKGKNDAPSDTLLDLAPKQNELSVWLVDEQYTNLNRLLASLAANRERIDVFDYALFSIEIFEQVGIQVQQTFGDSPDADSNKSHLALLNLTATQLADLAVCIWYSPTTSVGRLLGKKVSTLIIEAIRSGNFKLEELKPKMRSEIEKHLDNV